MGLGQGGFGTRGLGLGLDNTTGEVEYYPGKNITWSVIPQFPACQTLDLSHYFNLSRMTPSHVIFIVKENLNLGIALEVVDKKKSPSKTEINPEFF